jgi:hypothetical protein
MTDLKPCPFCGSSALIDRDWRGQDDDGGYYEISCTNCTGRADRFIGVHSENRESAVLWWNTRVQSVQPAQCTHASELSPRQQASKILFGDIHWVDREDMPGLMDDEFVQDDGNHQRRISPNALIAELEAAARTPAGCSPVTELDFMNWFITAGCTGMSVAQTAAAILQNFDVRPK